MYEHLGLTRCPPSIATFNAINTLHPDLVALQDGFWEEVKERSLDIKEILHVNGWLLDRVLTNLYFVDNTGLIKILKVHAKAIKNTGHPFWSHRQQVVEELRHKLEED